MGPIHLSDFDFQISSCEYGLVSMLGVSKGVKMTIEEIRSELFRLQDTTYRDFQGKLLPTVEPACIIGVRTPELRKLAKRLAGDDVCSDFLRAVPHLYFDENQLHAFLISEIKDFGTCLEAVERFLPYIDNWATCDQLSPNVFKRRHSELLEAVRRWVRSTGVYTVRFGIGMLMQHFLDEDFDLSYPEMVAEIRSDEYYINMMIAWYFATALAKQYDAVIPFLEQRRLDDWTHNKAIQKALESRRLPAERKDYLRGLKIKGKSAGTMA